MWQLTKGGAAAAACRVHLRVAWLCGVVLLFEGYDIAAVGYAIPSLADSWRVQPSTFTPVMTVGNIGLMLGSHCMGVLGDRLGRKPALIVCTVAFGAFSLLSAFAGSPLHLAALRFASGLGLGGGLPLARCCRRTRGSLAPPEYYRDDKNKCKNEYAHQYEQ